MDLNYVKKLIRLVAESEVDEVEIEEEGRTVRVAKHRNNAAAFQHPHTQETYVATQPLGQLGQPVAQAPTVPAQQYHEIKSPIVGTFYRAPAPDAAPFVEIGSVIQPGTVLCIVEAMKLMNEIEADISGKIVKVMVENGQPVEYDQTLFLLEKA